MTAADPAAVLAALPEALWPPLLSGVRSAADRLGRSQLPAVLQPYAGFTPARLGQGRARQAVVTAVADDARLREAIGATLAADLWSQAAQAPATLLADRFGAGQAAAALVGRHRWDEVAELVDRLPPAPSRPAAAAPDRRRATDHRPADAGLRRERDTAQRRAAAAEKRLGDLQHRLSDSQRQIEELDAAREAAIAALDDERSRFRDRLARLQRRVGEAEARARTATARVLELAGELDRLAARARAPEGESAEEVGAPARPRDVPAPAIPRSVRPATPGRPARLPPGITPDQPEAAVALLAIPGAEVILDGYNVSKDLRGVPTAGLAEQRAWLVRVAAAAAAGRGLRISVVFDGAGDRPVAAAAARIVRTIFTAAGETADERIVAMVRGLDDATPVVVVTSDREVAGDCAELGANVVASGVFLRAFG